MKTFFWYDLETSGLSGRYDRAMQFAGIRTDENLQQIGEPVNLLLQLPADTLPSPEALMVTGITPQKCRQEGLSEAEFAKFLAEEICTPGTTMVGYNSTRFDDEFLRHIFWRNFYDPYEWHYAEQRDRWDLLDVVRMTRALRPDGIKWPMLKGKEANRLELLARQNKLPQEHAHDALSDVEALIGLAKLLRQKQPRLYDFLWQNHDKKAVAKLGNLDDPQPFVYVSGRYAKYSGNLTVAFPLAPGKTPGSTLVYDLQMDPEELAAKRSGAEGKAEAAENPLHSFVKELRYNRNPAVAPLSVLRDQDAERLGLDMKRVKQNLQKLLARRDIADQLTAAWSERPDFPPAADVEGRLYDGFGFDADKPKARAVREASPEELADFHPTFRDERLEELLFRYKARNFPRSLSESEKTRWQAFCQEKFAASEEYLAHLQELAARHPDSFVLTELQLYLDGILD